MDALPYVDSLIREYLLFRGFVSSLEAFGRDLEADPGCGLQVGMPVGVFQLRLPDKATAHVQQLASSLCCRRAHPQQCCTGRCSLCRPAAATRITGTADRCLCMHSTYCRLQLQQRVAWLYYMRLARCCRLTASLTSSSASCCLGWTAAHWWGCWTTSTGCEWGCCCCWWCH